MLGRSGLKNDDHVAGAFRTDQKILGRVSLQYLLRKWR